MDGWMDGSATKSNAVESLKCYNAVQWSNPWMAEYCRIVEISRIIERSNAVSRPRHRDRDHIPGHLGTLTTGGLMVSGNCLAGYNKPNNILGIIIWSISFGSKDILVPIVKYCIPAGLLISHYKSGENVIWQLQHRWYHVLNGDPSKPGPSEPGKWKLGPSESQT